MRKFENCLASLTVSAGLAGACLALPSVAPSPVQAAPAPAPSLPPTSPVIANIDPIDLSDWRAAELADLPDNYAAYLSSHPNGWFKPIASSRLAPGLTPSLLQRRPYADASNPTAAETASMLAWEEELWRDAAAVGTNNAMRAYLLLAPKGKHIEEAVQGYLRTWPKLGEGIASDCAPEELNLRVTSRFNFERAYPQRAVDRGQEEKVYGTIIAGYKGEVLAFSNAVYTQPGIFAADTTRTVLGMRYQPLRAGCLQSLPASILAVNFKIGENTVFDQTRPTPDVIDAALELDKPTNLRLPEDRNLKVSTPHNGQYSVYSVRTRARFPAIVEYICVGGEFERARGSSIWSRLINGTHFVAPGDCNPFLRISALESITVDRNGNPITDPPAKGPVEIVVTRQATRALGAPKAAP